jgi:hypothetical protein
MASSVAEPARARTRAKRGVVVAVAVAVFCVEAEGDQVDILRAAVVGDRLLTVSSAGVASSALDGLAPQGFLPFPPSRTPPRPAPRPGQAPR